MQESVVQSLFKAYFTDGRILSDRATLEAVAVEGGLGRASVNDLLPGGQGEGEVSADEQDTQRLDISGVPFVVFNEALTLLGARAPETFRAMIERSIPYGAGESCEVNAAKGKRRC